MHPSISEMIDNDHRRNIIIIVGAVGMAVSVGCLLVRVYLRLVVYPPFVWDDFILFVATVGPIPGRYGCSETDISSQVVAIAQSSIIFAATSHGLTGFYLSPNQLYILQPVIPPLSLLYTGYTTGLTGAVPPTQPHPLPPHNLPLQIHHPNRPPPSRPVEIPQPSLLVYPRSMHRMGYIGRGYPSCELRVESLWK